MIDLGAGDGAAVLDAARRSPASLCVGIDADAAALREASARAARPVRRGGLPNALFLVADATSLPRPFAGQVDDITITLPWGSLLRLALAGDRRFAGDLAGALRPGGRLRIVVSVEDRDHVAIGAAAADGDLAALAGALEAVGLDVLERRPVTADDMAAIRSSWAKRLGIPTRRSASLLIAASPPILPATTPAVESAFIVARLQRADRRASERRAATSAERSTATSGEPSPAAAHPPRSRTPARPLGRTGRPRRDSGR
jgi:16S rRNA (adenine(1408)-N(1))-methyltransferase